MENQADIKTALNSLSSLYEMIPYENDQQEQDVLKHIDNIYIALGLREKD